MHDLDEDKTMLQLQACGIQAQTLLCLLDLLTSCTGTSHAQTDLCDIQAIQYRQNAFCGPAKPHLPAHIECCAAGHNQIRKLVEKAG